MATRSFISIKNPDGTYTGIYCHWDGYPEYTGRILKEYYNTKEKVYELISHGSASYIAPEIGEKNDFNNPDDRYCLFYHRDRGDDWENVKPKHFTSFRDLVNWARYVWCDYLYVFEDDHWDVHELS